MTKNKQEKKEARERAQAMGVSYTEALRHIRKEKEEAEKDLTQGTNSSPSGS